MSEVHERFRGLNARSLRAEPEWQLLTPEAREAVEVVSTVLPFRVNRHVLRQIDFSRAPDDPIFQLTFPQPGMLDAADYRRMADLVRGGAPRQRIETAAREIRRTLNPHPSGQATDNVPTLDGRPLAGMQHKYRETVLFFPAAGQTCHAYCTFCFRWAQFVDGGEAAFRASESRDLLDYLSRRREVTDLLVTGGDPLVMRTRVLRSYLEGVLDPAFEHVAQIRIGTKSVAYWPQRFTTDPDADDLLRFFEQIVAGGRQLAIMGHYSHPRELESDLAQAAVRRIRATGASVFMQSPLIRHVNDSAATWSDLWRAGIRLGAVPYYFFVERDTGPRHYFEVPLVRAWRIFKEAYRQVSGLGRTVRGPVMSAWPGKVLIDGIADVSGERVFALQMLQGRRSEWVRRPFYARFDPQAVWLDDLVPAFGHDRFFFEQPGAEVDPVVELQASALSC
ncbi:MAG: lysine 2,3-aminomutase [Acidobacteriota bacterium]